MGKEKGRKAGRPDQVEKLLEDWHDVFADIINVLVHGGKRIVNPEDLVDSPTASQYMAENGQLGEKFRDVCKKEVRGGQCYVILGLENQTDVCRTMPLRVMQYDAAAYESMIKGLQAANTQKGRKRKVTEALLPGQKLPPVCTVVLYFGLKHWDGPKSLREMLDIPEGYDSVIPDYRMNLVEVAFLDDETIGKFTSDFRVIAKFFKSKRLGEELETMYNDTKTWQHVRSLMEFFYTFTGDALYDKYKEFLVKESKKGEVRMCTLLDALARDSKQEGKREGVELGRYISVDSYMARHPGTDADFVMDEFGLSDSQKAGYRAWAAEGRPGTC